MFSGIIGAGTLTMAWFVQPALMYLKTPVSWYGVIWTVLNLTVGLAILLVFYIFRGFATPILKGYINQMTFSEMRATVLSIRNFIIRLMFAAIAPFIGWLNDMYSLQAALLVSAGIILLPGGIFLVLQFRKETD